MVRNSNVSTVNTGTATTTNKNKHRAPTELNRYAYLFRIYIHVQTKLPFFLFLFFLFRRRPPTVIRDAWLSSVSDSARLMAFWSFSLRGPLISPLSHVRRMPHALLTEHAGVGTKVYRKNSG